MSTKTADHAIPLLKVEQLTRSYRNRDGLVIAEVLRGVSFTVNRGDTVAVLGPSGSGKTTLLNVCALLDTPDSGNIFFDGEAVNGWDEKRRDRFRSSELGIIFQEHLLLPQLTVIENVLLSAMAPDMKKSTPAQRERARSLLERVSLADKQRRYPGELSTGERQRVAAARALMNTPRLVLADEPTGALDSENSRSVANLLVELTREHGSSLLMVTHSDEMASLMNYPIHLCDGRLL